MLAEDRELTERATKLEALLDEIETFPDPALRAKTAEVVQDLLLLYGEGLARMVAIVREAGGARILAAFSDDELVAHLLLLHDLHPVDVETRVRRALEEVRPYLQSHGGNVDFLGVEDGIARLRLQGSCSGCPSSTMTLKLAIEEAVQRAAPDLDGIEADGVAEPPPRPVGFVPASDLLKKMPAQPAPTWTTLGSLSQLSARGVHALEVGATPVLFLTLGETCYAYRNVCSGCGGPLEGAALSGSELSCPSCQSRYDVGRAGRCLDTPGRHLEPVPLLVRDGQVRVAVSGQL